MTGSYFHEGWASGQFIPLAATGAQIGKSGINDWFIGLNAGFTNTGSLDGRKLFYT